MHTAKKLREDLFASRLIAWYAENGRPLPWRDMPTPYRVWVSEVMLQQTRIEAVLPYFDRFMTALPDVRALAQVSPERLNKLWEGLGYYSRARHLREAAQIICEQYGGILPADYEKLLALPGIGEYTASAVCSIAFSLPTPTVDGNVLRVMARLRNDDGDVMLPKTRRDTRAFLETVIPQENPGGFNQALMELGERICLPHQTPHCEGCPVSDYCGAHAAGRETELPVRAKPKARRIEKRTVMVLITNETPPRIILKKRPEKSLLAGLWEFPNKEGHLPQKAVLEEAGRYGTPVSKPRKLPDSRHLFTHIEWRMTGFAVTVDPFEPAEDTALAAREQLLTEYAVPHAFSAYTRLFKED